uniref:Uncharacterized protein n=1 Tax=Physcomitrium patens TaxID=3218 RepID=A0A2K1IZ65_PHYPA|nr:hypothetical protein PHYPA_024389 [Physcomitrium patens]
MLTSLVSIPNPRLSVNLQSHHSLSTLTCGVGCCITCITENIQCDSGIFGGFEGIIPSPDEVSLWTGMSDLVEPIWTNVSATPDQVGGFENVRHEENGH